MKIVDEEFWDMKFWKHNLAQAFKIYFMSVILFAVIATSLTTVGVGKEVSKLVSLCIVTISVISGYGRLGFMGFYKPRVKSVHSIHVMELLPLVSKNCLMRCSADVYDGLLSELSYLATKE